MNRASAAAATAALFSIAGTAQGQFATFERIYLQGEQAEGLPQGVIFNSLVTDAILNQNGQVAFQSRLAGPGVTSDNNEAIFVSGPGGTTIAVRTGDAAIGAVDPMQVWDDFDLRSFSNDGRVGLTGRIRGPGITGVNSEVVGADLDGSGPAILAQTRTQAPGLSAGVQYNNVFFGSNFAGTGSTVLFESSLRGTGVTSDNNEALFSNSGGSLLVLAREGEQAAGLAPGAVYNGFFNNSRVNEQGDLTFVAEVSGGGLVNPGSSPNPAALFAQRGGNVLSPVAVSGDQAAGLANGVQYSSFGFSFLNEAGQIAFQARLGGSEVTNANDSALYINTAGVGDELVVRTGDQALGYASGVTYDGLRLQDRGFNNNGDLLYRASLTGVGITDNINDNALYLRGADGTTDLFLRGGDQALGLELGVLYDEFDAFNLNDSGQIAFLAELTDGRDAYYATDPFTNELVLLAAEGELFNVSSDASSPDFRVISGLGTREGIQLNNRGEILIDLQFGDDRIDGLFLVTVPTPGTTTLAAITWLAAARRRR